MEKYGLGGILFAFALVVMAIFAIKKRVFHAQRLRYRQRLRELGDNSEDVAVEKRTQREAAQLAQSIILEDQRRDIMSGSQVREGGLDFAASQRSLALAQAAAGNMNVSTMSLPKAERSFDIRFEKLGLTLPTGVDIIKVRYALSSCLPGRCNEGLLISVPLFILDAMHYRTSAEDLLLEEHVP